jgi:tRNA-specific 2-thiouridylase
MSNKRLKTVFVAMSGGVDSSVAAFLLKKQGYDVVGVFMRCYNLDGCAERDAEDARRVAEHIGIPFYVWDFEEEYKKRVVDYMIEGYRAGITPNPDVMCNREIKFGLFLKKALAAGADFVATGHYVRLQRTVKSEKSKVKSVSVPKLSTFDFRLSTSRDKNKDQSYFLWTLTQKELRHCLFPIGDYIKPDVRKIAKKAGLPTAEKKDSQGVCFLGDISVEDFLRARIKAKKGALVATTGEVLGTHHGAAFYTIGQRHLGIGYRVSGIGPDGQKKKDQLPFYVASKDMKTNTVVVAEGSENPALYKREVKLANVNWISGLEPRTSDLGNRILKMSVFTRVRYRQPLAKATLILSPKSKVLSSRLKLIFDKPQKFVAEGQSAVFYNKKGEMLGGGVIV